MESPSLIAAALAFLAALAAVIGYVVLKFLGAFINVFFRKPLDRLDDDSYNDKDNIR